MSFVGFCFRGEPEQGPSGSPSKQLCSFPRFQFLILLMKSKKKIQDCVQKVLTRTPASRGLFIKALFYIPCNTDGDDAQVSLVSSLQLPYSAFPFI